MFVSFADLVHGDDAASPQVGAAGRALAQPRASLGGALEPASLLQGVGVSAGDRHEPPAEVSALVASLPQLLSLPLPQT